MVEPVSLSLNPCCCCHEAVSLSSKKYHCCRIRAVCLIFIADCRTHLLANPFRHHGTRFLIIKSASSSLNLSPVESVSHRICLHLPLSLSPVESVSLSWNPHLASAVSPSMNPSLNRLTTAIGRLGCLGEGRGRCVERQG